MFDIKDSYIILFFVIILILWFIYLIYNHKNKMENFENNKNSNIQFLTKDEVFNMLKEDKDNYFGSFTIYDWEVRNAYNKEQYLDKIKESIHELNNEQKERLTKLTKIIDEKIKNVKLPYFNGEKASLIQWNFGYTLGKNYEDGLPHTRNDIIMLGQNTVKQDDKNLMKTLTHEKVHLYQKLYPDDNEKYKEFKGFRRLRRREVNDKIRANPDIDSYIYIDKNGNELKTVYNEKATGLEDTKTYPEDNQSSEHPNEAMAIEIEKMI